MTQTIQGTILSDATISRIREAFPDALDALALFERLPESMQRLASPEVLGAGASLEAIHRAAREAPHAALARTLAGVDGMRRTVGDEIERLRVLAEALDRLAGLGATAPMR